MPHKSASFVQEPEEDFEEDVVDDEDLKAQRLLELLEKDDDGVAIEYLSGDESAAKKAKAASPDEEDEDLDDY